MQTRGNRDPGRANRDPGWVDDEPRTGLFALKTTTMLLI